MAEFSAGIITSSILFSIASLLTILVFGFKSSRMQLFFAIFLIALIGWSIISITINYACIYQIRYL